MPHGSLRIGDVEVVALCDGVVGSERSIERSFPSVPGHVWELVRRSNPETISPTGRWQLHVHAFLLRANGRTLLFDAGFGGGDAPAVAWTGTGGRLMEELAALSVDPSEVELVVLSHAHDDHVGWAVGADGGPAFPKARYLLHEADWGWVRRPDDPDNGPVAERCLRPLAAAGILDTCGDGHRIGTGLTLRHAPGHTPGHQVLVIDSAGARGMLAADSVNHPVQLVDPTWFGTSDDDPRLAAATRAALVDLAERQELLVVTSHFPNPFGRIVRHEGRHAWSPVRGT